MHTIAGHRAAFILSAVLLGLYSLANGLNLPHLWSLWYAPFLPAWWLWLTVALIALTVIPPVAGRFTELINALSQKLSSPGPARLFLLLSGVVFAALWTLLRTRTWFLGDGNLRLNQLVKGQLVLWTEPGDFLIHALLYRHLISPFGLEPEWSYHILSVAAGVFYLIGAWRLARYLYPSQWLMLYLALLGAGLTVLFFGYVESYSLLAALLPHTALAVIRAVDGNGSGITGLILILIASLLHPVAALLLSGTALFLLIHPLMRRLSPQIRKASPWALTIIGVVVLYTIRALDLGGLAYYIMPLVGGDSAPCGVLSVRHLLNIGNQFLLAALPLMPLAAVFITSRPQSDRSGGEANLRPMLRTWMALPPAVFILFFTPQLGAPRDWDLFALAAFWVALALIVPRHATEPRLPRGMVPALVLAFAVTLSFAAVSASIPRSTDRFVALIEHARFKNLFKEYRMLSRFAETTPGISHRALTYSLAAWNEPPYTHDDSLAILNQLADHYIDAGNGGEAQRYLSLAFRCDSLDINTHLTLTHFARRFGSQEDLLAIAAQLERKFKDNALGRMNAGVLYKQLGRSEEGARNLTIAYRLDSTNNTIALNYAIQLFETGDYRGSVRLLERLLAADPDMFLACYYLGAGYYALDQPDRALAQLERASGLAETESNRRLVASLVKMIRDGR